MHRKPDLAILLNDLGGGGAERVVVDIANRFATQGLKVDLVMAHANGILQKELLPAVNVVALGKNRMEQCLPGYLAYLRKAQPPKVMTTIESATLVGCLAKLASRHPHRLYIRMANTLQRPFGEKRWLKYLLWRAMARHLYRLADKIICVSTGLQHEVDALVKKRVPTVTVFNPVLTQAYFDKLAQRLPRLSPSPYVLAVGRFDAQKDYPTLFKAFRLFKKHNPKHHLLILGEGKLRPHLTKLAHQLGIADAVHMPGFVVNPYPYMAKADIFAMSSLHEGASNALVQALAATPRLMVSTDCPHGSSEILGDGRFGHVVPLSNPQAFANAMMQPPPTYTRQALHKHLQQFELAFSANRYLAELGLKTAKKSR